MTSLISKNCNFRQILWNEERCTKSGHRYICLPPPPPTADVTFSKPEFSELCELYGGNMLYNSIATVIQINRWHYLYISCENSLYFSFKAFSEKAGGTWIAVELIYRESLSTHCSSIIKVCNVILAGTFNLFYGNAFCFVTGHKCWYNMEQITATGCQGVELSPALLLH